MIKWAITKDVINDGAKIGVCTRPFTEAKREGAKVADLPHAFRLLDDDGVIYFHGRADAEDFSPLDDWAGPSYGCTSIQFYGKKTRRWETL